MMTSALVIRHGCWVTWQGPRMLNAGSYGRLPGGKAMKSRNEGHTRLGSDWGMFLEAQKDAIVHGVQSTQRCELRHASETPNMDLQRAGQSSSCCSSRHHALI